ncbi:TetR/AcrR family transcriptional regulator [Mycolicibacterium smegmatis]|nr:TetR family transcriptional regulator [Mycolicibacterium smegmatis]ABK70475.1 TetR family protein transcriptional regulator [Mycolicibacterium smegmatis MC2 155]AIU08592.1 transcriptional regulator [Mycolicibacterium smegmatis MC2 155]AIU15217.1 transcriptional regulator [Mycolicibacterium smegmatis]AIU21840.1 transcriptional regulator [Mycolicibacterium smegmatis]AWT54425.1 TetR family protein transcriptional regulator [Mycolicibacterium smegmatis MKD8]
MANPTRRTRSDALQNRARILEVAAKAFAEQGLDTAPAAIAKLAGVGIGTLYRHFPTRETLIDAAYRHQLTRVCDAVADLAARHPGDEATRRWMERFIDYATAKSGMSEALNAVIASGADPFADSLSMLTEAVGTLLEAGRRDHTLRTDVTAGDVLLFMGGIAYAAQHGTRDQARRLVDLFIDALTKDTRPDT